MHIGADEYYVKYMPLQFLSVNYILLYIANDRLGKDIIKSCIFLSGQNIHKFGSALVTCSRRSYNESFGIYTEYQCYRYKITC